MTKKETIPYWMTEKHHQRRCICKTCRGHKIVPVDEEMHPGYDGPFTRTCPDCVGEGIVELTLTWKYSKIVPAV